MGQLARNWCGLRGIFARRAVRCPAGNSHRYFATKLGFEVLEGRRMLASIAVEFNDIGGAYSLYYNAIESHLVAAADDWFAVLGEHPGTVLETTVRFSASVSTTEGGSVSSKSIGPGLVQSGAGYEIRTGIDANGPDHDIQIAFGTAFLRDELWFDPDPFTRSDSMQVPAQKLDAMSYVLHELGHAFGVNGYYDPTNGSLPDRLMLDMDRYISFDGEDLFFNGPNAIAEYGGPVPLSNDGRGHIDRGALPAEDQQHLMIGPYFDWHTRYYITDLDLAILADVMVPLENAPPRCSAITTQMAQ